MGGLCSRSAVVDRPPSNGNRVDHYESGASHRSSRRHESSKIQSSLTAPAVQERMEKELQEPKESNESFVFHDMGTAGYGSNNPDEFYDGIPRYKGGLSHKSRSVRSKQAAVAKEVGSRLSRAGTVGLGKAVDVLDTLGSSMTNLNHTSGFGSGVVTKGNEITILAFEVANTIVKGSTLVQSLSNKNIKHVKEVVLHSEGVQHLVSKDMGELLRIVAADKREELKVFSAEVIRFGNRCKDPQWHNLNRYFEKIGREHTPQKELKGEAELIMQLLMNLVQNTAELYHELHALDRFELDYQRRRQEEDGPNASQKGDTNLSIFRAELKGQRKQVKALKKKSLWSRSLEEVMEKLVDIVRFLHLEIHNAFGSADGDESVQGSLSNHKRLGPAGLSLHYANIIIQIDTLVARSSSIHPNTRDTLYQSLPPNIKSALRSKLQSFHVKEELTVTEIKAEMEKTLHWLVPVATNTAKAHHGFGWVGEWASTGSEVNRKPAGHAEVIRIETLHHADKEKTEAYILDIVVWLHHLFSQFKANNGNGTGVKLPIISPIYTPLQNTNQLDEKHEATNTLSVVLTVEDEEMLVGINKKKRAPGISKSQDFDSKTMMTKHDKLSKSSGHSTTMETKEVGVSVIDFGHDKEKTLDAIDRVDTLKISNVNDVRH